jgi:flagella basal body P-ring formation protein FlgA
VESNSLVSVALSGALSCATSLNPTWSEGTPVEYNQWQIPFCQKYMQEYESLYFEKIVEKKTSPHIVLSGVGEVTVGPIKSGRVQVDWYSRSLNAGTTIWLKVNARQEAWVFTRALPPEGDITPDSVRRELVNVAPLINNKGILLDSPVGKTAVRQIRKGQVITTDMVSDPPLVKRNGKVTVTVDAGPLKISAIGIALETGWHLDDVISVKVENSNGPVNAKITGKSHVLVEI